ncbi:MAG: putative toxin-antitoxin system toxin component, PIN family [Terracidiphilus sp.]|jgi:putative PIN family toxin of toxin-antitoxin system
MRIVMDTSVLVAGLRSRLGASAALLKEIAAKRVELVASPALFLEYEAVLKREEHSLPAEYVDGFLAELALCIHPAEIRFVWRPQLSDADDEMVLEAAINGQAEAIVTHNRRDFERAAQRFGIEVLSPAELLEQIRRKGVEP